MFTSTAHRYKCNISDWISLVPANILEMAVCGSSVFVFVLLCVHSSFAIILNRKRKLVALLLLSY